MRKFLLVATFFTVISPAIAQEDTLLIINPHAYESVGSVTAAGVFLTIENHGDTDDVLLSAHTDRAKKTELHTIIDENGVKKMRPVEKMIIHPHKPVSLERGGDHVMLLGVTNPLKAGETIPLRLEFQNAGTREVDVTVIPQGAHTSHDHSHDHH